MDEDCAGVPDLVDMHRNFCDESEDSDEWDEEPSGEQTVCLFCPLQFRTIAVALDHCRTVHNFDLLELKKKFDMDIYSYIKMINYIRLHKPEPKILTDSSEALWNDDVYMKTGDFESWLQYDFDDLGSAPSTPHYAIDGKTPISNISFSDMQKKIHELTLELKHKDTMLDAAMRNIANMKEITRTIIEAGDEKMESKNPQVPGYDGDYFNSYTHFGIHHEMLCDQVRTESYRDAILKNAELFKDKLVLDVGCGTGILSMFFAKAGASKVYGIDQSEVVFNAMEIVRENKVEDKIHLIKERIEDVSLPVDKVDVIVSEFMGYFLLFEGMTDSFLYARDRFLNEGGLLLPNRCTISLVGASLEGRYKDLVNFWDDVYGFKMQCMKSQLLKEATVEIVPENELVTEPVLLSEIDLNTCTAASLNFSTKFTLKATKTGTLRFLVGYFDTFFDLTTPVEFSTGPHATPTHWKQTLFILEKPVTVKEGETIEGSLTCTKLRSNARGLSVKIILSGAEYRYHLD